MPGGTFSWMTRKNMGGQFLIAQHYLWYIMQVQKKEKKLIRTKNNLYLVIFPTGWSAFISYIFCKEDQYFAKSTPITLLKTRL